MAGSSTWKDDRKQTFVSVAALGVLALALGVGAVAWGSTARRGATPTVVSPVPPGSLPVINPSTPPSGWKIDVAGDGAHRAQHFSGFFAPGQVLFAPAGASFTVHAQPTGVSGMFFAQGRDASFDQQGGELNVPAQHGGHVLQECRAPHTPGLYSLAWKKSAGDANGAQLNLIVLAPADAQTQGEKTFVKVNGKSIGAYHDPAQSPVRRVRENANLYKRPDFFATFTPEMISLKVGPDLELGQFVAFKDFHGPDGKKVYTTLRHTDVLPPRPELIDKLVKLRDRLRSKGVKVTRFWITSGFRTPEYNHSIGGASYSRHCYGDAVDLCIDEDGDKKMDDLNGDGRIDRKDGIIIGNACRELELEGAVVPGGIGVYEWQSDDSVGSHVHIDCRGYISRWGQIGCGRTKKSFVWWPKAEFQEEEAGE